MWNLTTSKLSRTLSALGMVLVLLALVAWGCCGVKECSRPYLVLYAFSEEGDLIRGNMSSVKTEMHLGREVARGMLSGKDVVLAELGVGMSNAAMTAQRMLDNFEPQAVIVSGIAGSVDSSVHIGDIVVCQSWITHDYGYIGNDGFKSYGVEVALPGTDSLTTVLAFDINDAMLKVVMDIEIHDLNLSQVGDREPALRVGGTGVSGNTFIDSEQKRHWLGSEFGALITDMESAAVAQVCAVNGVPLVVFRAASDLAGGSGSETARIELDQFFKVAADNSSSVVMKFLEEL